MTQTHTAPRGLAQRARQIRRGNTSALRRKWLAPHKPLFPPSPPTRIAATPEDNGMWHDKGKPNPAATTVPLVNDMCLADLTQPGTMDVSHHGTAHDKGRKPPSGMPLIQDDMCLRDHG